MTISGRTYYFAFWAFSLENEFGFTMAWIFSIMAFFSALGPKLDIPLLWQFIRAWPENYKSLNSLGLGYLSLLG